MDRVNAIRAALGCLEPDDLVLSTTGMISRELHYTNDRPSNFYMIGSMGLVSALALGVALAEPRRKVLILEGDGSALMSLGMLPLIASESPAQLVHLVLDNESYESTGGQPSISSQVPLEKIAKASGYKNSVQVANEEMLTKALRNAMDGAGPHFILGKVAIAPVPGIPRVQTAPAEIARRFASSLQSWA